MKIRVASERRKKKKKSNRKSRIDLIHLLHRFAVERNKLLIFDSKFCRIRLEVVFYFERRLISRWFDKFFFIERGEKWKKRLFNSRIIKKRIYLINFFVSYVF